MKAKSISILAILVGLTLTFSIAALSIQYQQQVWAPRDCGSCIPDFMKTIHEFEKNVIGGVIDPNSVPPSPVVRELLEAYVQDVNRIFLGGPDTIPGLVESYQEAVLSLLNSPPPEPEKHPGISFMQDFKELTTQMIHQVIQQIQQQQQQQRGGEG
jgi:hypothetical protein